MAATLLILTAILLNIPADECVEIIGGKEVRNHSVPFMALVRSREGICGGALIKPDWVLTAAHCQARKMTVTLGALSLTQKEKEKQQFTVTQTFPHNQFNNKTGENDLMLLKMNKPAILNKFVSTLALPKPQTDVRTKMQCSVAGWGITKPKKTQPSDKLMQVTNLN
ncbi:granzyme G-like [Megalops cyprinoides]|uniref:granzyme G-like n=1 Tax=Megalops cyprinoides TaxID=118141 RepID=UPI00186467C8|nr:granzyme G-like [Megalops cyprinoides]